MSTPTQEGITNPFHAIARYAQAHNVRSIKDLPGCWEVQVDAAWWFAVNGHRAPQECSKGATLQPYEAYVTFNGWPAGILSPDGEGVFAAGSAGNTEAFITAVLAEVTP